MDMTLLLSSLIPSLPGAELRAPWWLILLPRAQKSREGARRRPHLYATVALPVPPNPQPSPQSEPELLYCPTCGEEVTDPLTCGDCSAVICRRCGTPLESPDELGMG